MPFGGQILQFPGPVIFLLPTWVLPLLLLWGLYAVAKGVFELPGRMPGLIGKR